MADGDEKTLEHHILRLAPKGGKRKSIKSERDLENTLKPGIFRLESKGEKRNTIQSEEGSKTDSDSDVSDDSDSFLSEDDSDFEKRMRRARERDDYVIIEKYKSLIKKIGQEEESSGSSGDVLQAAAYTEPLIEPDDGRTQNITLEELVSNLCHIWSHHRGRTVFLQGNSGSGKTFIARKIMLDWASQRYLYFAHYVVFFYLNCEELKCSSEKMSLIDILSLNSSLTTTEIRHVLRWSSRVLIIIDGLEKLEPLQEDYCIVSETEKALSEKIIFALIKKRILKHCRLLITSRTHYPERTFYHCDGVKLMGFSEQAVEEFFRKFFQDDVLFRKSLECVKANGALFTFCSVPLICWMVCTIMKENCSDGGDMTCDLETTTSIYVDFVFTLLKHHSQGLNQPVESLLKSLGRLAEKGILEQQVLLEEKTVDEIVPGLSDSQFLCTFLLKRHVQKKTVLSFRQGSFQEFFTALYYVLLDEGQAKEKVKGLLHLVDKRRAWSSFSLIKDAEVSQSLQWQHTLLFLCGLCKRNSTSSIFETHNLALAKNIATQLKEWIHLCVERNQNEDLLFTLRCLYELHDRSFVAEVLDGLALMDLSDVRLKKTDIPVLLFSFQNIQNISNMRFCIKLEDLQFLQSKLPKCTSLWLKMDSSLKEAGHLIPALLRGTTENELIIKSEGKDHCYFQDLVAAVKEGQVTLCVEFSHTHKLSPDIRKLTLTCPEQTLSTVGWQDIVEIFLHTFISDKKEKCSLGVLHVFPGLETVHFETENWDDGWTPLIISVIQACPNLNQLRVDSIDSFIELTDLPESLKQSGWTLKVQRKSLLIERDRTSVIEVKPETQSTELKEEDCSDHLSHCSETTSEQSSPEAEEQVTPERVESDGKEDDCCGGNTLQYRFVCPRAGRFRCTFTNIVFVTEGEGHIRYRVVGWDPRILSGLGQMMPAGPLYKINCTTTSVRQVHFPHCEIFSEETESSLSVAHIVSGNVEVLEPVTVTGSHVVLNIADLSLYGLLKKVKFHFFPVDAQLLLFLRSATEEENILDVYLLPSSVTVAQVKEQHTEDLYIKTSSQCCLTPGTEYSLRCETPDTEVQPETGKFRCDFGPNYHFLFEVFVKIDVEEVRLGLWDKTSKTPAWEPRRVILKASSQTCELATDRNPSEFVNRHRASLIQRVTSVMSIAESLKTKHMIHNEMYSNIRAAETQQDKTRLLFDVLDSGGDAVKAEFYRLLKTNESSLMKDLESCD